MKKRIGFFGGCFNPPTVAHINLIQEAINQCKLDKVIFVPVNDYYQKKELITFKHRYNMLNIVCKDYENIEVSDIEVKEDRKLSPIEIFSILKGKNSLSEVFFILGSDNLKKMINWKNFENIVGKYKYIILPREHYSAENIIEKNEKLRANKNNFYILKNIVLNNVSSTEVRKNINTNIITDKVKEYIINNKLYI